MLVHFYDYDCFPKGSMYIYMYILVLHAGSLTMYTTHTRMCCIHREIALLCTINQVEENSMLLACVETRTTIAIVCEIYS